MIVGVILILALILAAWTVAKRRFDPWERRYVGITLAAHVFGAFVLVAYHIYLSWGDLMGYYRFGSEIVNLVTLDFTRYLPEVFKLILQMDNAIPGGAAMWQGSSSGSMCGISALLILVFGASPYLTSVPISIWAFIGQVELYRSMRGLLPPEDRRPVALGILFVPSVLFWTSGVIKEAVALGALGIICSCIAALARRRLAAVVPLAFALGIVILLKPYILIPLAMAIATLSVVSRGKSLSLWQKVLGVVLAIAGLVLVAKLFPRFGVDHLADTIATSRRGFAAQAGETGSTIELGDPDEESLSGQLWYAPLALLNALARPSIFDVRNGSQLMAALETTVLVLMAASLLWRNKIRDVVREVVRTPVIAAASVFVLTFGIAVGLSTTNLGSLSRYRAPMMPMYVAAMLLVRARMRRKATQAVTPRARDARHRLRRPAKAEAA
jgi:hypothetical protein